MIRMAYIYALRQQGIDEVRYVGQTVNTRNRLMGHLSPSEGQGRSKNEWVVSVLDSGGQIEMDIIEECVLENAKQREDFWINHYKTSGHRLTNTARASHSLAFARFNQMKAMASFHPLTNDTTEEETLTRIEEHLDSIKQMLEDLLEAKRAKTDQRMDRLESMVAELYEMHMPGK